METKDITEEFIALKANQEFLEESLNDMAARFKELKWDLLHATTDAGLSLEHLKELDERISDMVETNPLLKRAAQLRHGYIFGGGVRYTDLKPAAERVMVDNEDVVFSVQAYEAFNKASMTSGNLFLLYNEQTKTFIRVPLKEITGVETDPDSSEIVWHIRRTWNSNGKQNVMWYRTDTNRSPVRRKSIDGVPVSSKHVMFHERRNAQIGWTWGVPDALAAIAYAISYANYLSDNSRLVHAYAQYAFRVSNATAKGMANAAARVARTDTGVGGTAFLAAGNELTPVNATGSQVNFNNGQPLAAMVASTLGVSVIALISSPGAAGGSYGAAQTLDKPTAIVMKTIQDMWSQYYRRIFRYLKSPNGHIAFPSIDSDPVYRQITSAALAYETEALHQEEYRAIVLDLLDVADIKPGLPEKRELVRDIDKAVPGGPQQGDTNNDGRTDTISKKD